MSQAYSFIPNGGHILANELETTMLAETGGAAGPIATASWLRCCSLPSFSVDGKVLGHWWVALLVAAADACETE